MNAKNTNTLPVENTVAVLQTGQDLKNALLVVSLVINLFIFTAWLVVQADPSLTLVLLESR